MASPMPEVALYVKSRKVVTSFYRAAATDTSRSATAYEPALGVAMGLEPPKTEAETTYMLPDEQARAVALVEEVAARRGYVVKLTDVGKANPLTQFVETHLKGVEQFPVLVVPASKRRLEGLTAFTENTLCAAMPTELKTTRAFSYLKVRTGDIKEVQRSLLSFEEVREVHLVTGDWDVLVVLEFPPATASSKRQVLDFIIEKVAKIGGVEGTSTMVPEYSTTKFPL